MPDTYIIEAVVGSQDPEVVRLPDQPEKPFGIADLFNCAAAYANERGISFTSVGIRQYKNGNLISPSLISGDMIDYELAMKPGARRQGDFTS